MFQYPTDRIRGFTLVELAIALVIIGLVIGSILAGQDLIKSAELRALTKDIQRYNAAAGTFRSRYDGLPGDLLGEKAINQGFVTRDATAGQGDDNGFIEGCDMMATDLGCENASFWLDLTQASLLNDAFTTADSVPDGNNGPATPVTTNVQMAGYLPTIRLRESAFLHIFPHSGRNFWFLGAMRADAGGAGTGGAITVLNPVVGELAGLTVLEAAQVDDKIDDGTPTMGIVRAVSAFTPASGMLLDAGATAATGTCVLEGITPGTIDNDETYYLSNQDHASELNCNIMWRASF